MGAVRRNFGSAVEPLALSGWSVWLAIAVGLVAGAPAALAEGRPGAGVFFQGLFIAGIHSIFLSSQKLYSPLIPLISSKRHIYRQLVSGAFVALVALFLSWVIPALGPNVAILTQLITTQLIIEALLQFKQWQNRSFDSSARFMWQVPVEQARALISSGVDKVVVLHPETRSEDLRALLWLAKSHESSLATEVIPAGAEHIRFTSERIEGRRVYLLRHPDLRDEPRVFLRGVFWVCTAVGVTLLVPLFALLASLIMRQDGRPVFFRQIRIGYNGAEFRMSKFRSMVRDAEAKLAHLSTEDKARFLREKPENDPRILPLGGFLRRTSLDELPQLFNVLSGHMVLVGPRPESPEEAALYTPEQRRRLLVRPGVTGLWQVSGRSLVSVEERLDLDIKYLEGWSNWLDVKILVMTFVRLFRDQDAW